MNKNHNSIHIDMFQITHRDLNPTFIDKVVVQAKRYAPLAGLILGLIVMFIVLKTAFLLEQSNGL